MKSLLEKYLVIKSHKDVLLCGIAAAATGLIIYWIRGVANAPYVCFAAGITLGLLLLKRPKSETKQ
jgi:hypothetical protein